MKKIISLLFILFFVYSCGKKGSLEYSEQKEKGESGSGYFIESDSS